MKCMLWKKRRFKRVLWAHISLHCVIMWSSKCFPHLTRLTRRVSLVEHELLILPGHLRSPPVFSGVRVTRSLVLYVCFVDRCLSYSTNDNKGQMHISYNNYASQLMVKNMIAYEIFVCVWQTYFCPYNNGLYPTYVTFSASIQLTTSIQ